MKLATALTIAIQYIAAIAYLFVPVSHLVDYQYYPDWALIVCTLLGFTFAGLGLRMHYIARTTRRKRVFWYYH